MLSVQLKKHLSGFLLDVAFESGEETLALLGASGCGKSMTLKCIAGLEQPDSGRIVLNDRVLFDSDAGVNLTPQQRRVGYLFQQYALFPNMTVEQNIAAGCRQRDRRVRQSLVREKIHAMRLEGLERKRPGQLSGGQQQRVALARILINEPELLLLDEPFSALDSYLKWQLELELSDTLKEYSRGTLFVSHSRDEVYRLCSRVCVLKNGYGRDSQTVKELFQRPGTLAAAELSGCKNFSRVEILPFGAVSAVDWGVTLNAAQPFDQGFDWLGVRAHYVGLSATPGGENSFLCTVDRVVEDVFSTVVMLRTPGGSDTLLRAELSKERWVALDSPMQVYATIPPDSMMPLRG